MRFTLFILFVFCFGALSAQIKFERRIIIEQDTFYAVEINNETQLAKLYVGNINEPINNATIYALPAGTKRNSNREIAFAWDIYQDTLYCINYTEYAQNSPVNSLKVIALKGLELFNEHEDPLKKLMQAAYANRSIPNLPLINTYKKYTYMDDLFFDLKIHAGMIYQFYCVKNELTIWKYENNQWEQSEVYPFVANGAFSVFGYKNVLNVLSNKDYFLYPLQIYVNPHVHIDTSTKILLENRNTGETLFADVVLFEDGQQTIKTILEKLNQ